MKLSKKDWLVGGVMFAVGALLYVGTLKKLGNDVPDNPEHHSFYQQLEQGGSRIELEKGCNPCHEVSTLPASHPHKEECMVCHRPK